MFSNFTIRNEKKRKMRYMEYPVETLTLTQLAILVFVAQPKTQNLFESLVVSSS
jgi:hypothetical protein